MRTFTHGYGPPRRNQAGMSLMESDDRPVDRTVLMLVLSTVFVTSNQTYSISAAPPTIENGRFAVQIIGDDVALAGHYGRYSPGSSPCRGSGQIPAASPWPNLRAGGRAPVQG
jgi:Tfp pilus assembly protein PilW